MYFSDWYLTYYFQAAAPSKRKKVEEDTSPPISVTVTKAQRMKDEKNLKVSDSFI